MLNDKNTEIMVLKEMIKSTKAMVRAKDVDLLRLRKKFASQDFLALNLSEEDRQLTALRSGLAKHKTQAPPPNRLAPVGLLKPSPGPRLKARHQHPEPEPQEEEPERLVAPADPAAPEAALDRRAETRD